MASSAHNQQQQQLPNMYGATAAPPPTPSTHPNHDLLSTSAAAETLSKLLHRLPPTLSLPTRRSSSPSTTATTTSPPLISLSDQNSTHLLATSSQLGFFQLTNHSIPPQLARSAESESLSLFDRSKDQKESCFPKNWPLGFDGDEDDDGDGKGESFCLDASCSTDSTELSLTSLREFTREMKRVGLEIIEMLACAVGFENPVREDPTCVSYLIWISEGLPGNKPELLSRVYPYVVGLQYQIRCQNYSLLADSGWVSVSPHVESILVTLGDIAQVWSNGKLKKVRGRPVACLGNGDYSRCITMSLLVTLPIDSSVSPLLPKVDVGGNKDGKVNKDDEGEIDKREESVFSSFPFEDYAWKVYHERLLFKHPLDRYRI